MLIPNLELMMYDLIYSIGPRCYHQCNCHQYRTPICYQYTHWGLGVTSNDWPHYSA